MLKGEDRCLHHTSHAEYSNEIPRLCRLYCGTGKPVCFQPVFLFFLLIQETYNSKFNSILWQELESAADKIFSKTKGWVVRSIANSCQNTALYPRQWTSHINFNAALPSSKLSEVSLVYKVTTFLNFCLYFIFLKGRGILSGTQEFLLSIFGVNIFYVNG